MAQLLHGSATTTARREHRRTDRPRAGQGLAVTGDAPPTIALVVGYTCVSDAELRSKTGRTGRWLVETLQLGSGRKGLSAVRR
jgi:hypothetical protein